MQVQQQEQASQAGQLEQAPSFVAQVIPRGISGRPLSALETAIATLALDARHPIALEVAGDERGVRLLIRASDAEGLAHLKQQVQALYPQASIGEVMSKHDPLRLEQGEALTVVELAAGAAPYRSLGTPDARAWNNRVVVGEDPLLGVLGALSGLPKGVRAVAQLALVPAAAQWSRRYWRKAVEHPLDPERERDRRLGQSRNSTGPSAGAIVALGIVAALALVWRRWSRQILPLIPLWVKYAVPLALHGHMPSLTPPELLQVAGFVTMLFLVAFAISRLVQRLRGKVPLYDMRQVGEKTKRVAYRARLRFYVIGPVTHPVLAMHEGSLCPQKLSWLVRALCRIQASALVHAHCLAHLPRQANETATRSLLRAGGRVVAFVLVVVFSQLPSLLRLVIVHFRQAYRQLRARREESLRRRILAARLAAAYRQYASPSGNFFVPRVRHLRQAHLVPRTGPGPMKARHRILSTFGHVLMALVLGRARWERGLARSRLYLSVDELAALWHLVPEQDAPDVAGLEHGQARSRPLPPALLNAAGDSLLPYRLGECSHAGKVWPVYVPRDVLHQNSLAVAATGKGKSTLFAHLALAHLAGNPGEGLFFMEPHGDTIAALLGSLPASRHDDVTLIDLSDETAVVGLNPLDMTQGRGRDKTVENTLSVFIAFWQKQRSWGPRTENILQFALLALAEANLRRLDRDGDDIGAEEQYTLLDVIPLLQKHGYRDMVLQDVRDPVVLDWWKKYYEPLRQSFRDEMISSIINKISKYAAAKVSRRILGQSRATCRLSDDILAGRAILVNTASGVVGEEVSALVGATLVGLFQTAFAEQIRRPLGERRRFWVVIDEFQTFLGIDYNTMLAELRKYGGAFALATQSLSYLDEVDHSLKPTVLANSDHLFAFAMSADDAKVLVPSLDGLEVSDLVTLDAYTCYARLQLGARRLPPFSLHIAPPPAWDTEIANAIRLRSNERNTRAVSLVDDEVSPEQPERASVQATQDDGGSWPGEEATGTSVEEIKNPLMPPDAPRKRGGRGGRGGNNRREENELARYTADGTPLSQPYVLTDSARARPRSGAWHREDPERDEGGEMGGEW